jgi:hypothetical protein
MFTYKYIICTIPSNKKYWTRKNIYLNDKLFKFEDNKYSIKQMNKLLSNINVSQYYKINKNKLPKK